MLVIGLTGGIATGKSTVSKNLLIQGIPVVDADTIAREVVEPGRRAHKQVVEAFDLQVPDLLDEGGRLNRAALGQAVFGNSERLKTLNKIVHGAVKREIARQLFWTYVSGASMAVLDVPLLFEAGLDHICGVTISVSTDDTTQLKRLLERNPELSEEDAKKRILSQLPMEVRDSKADKVIDNNGSLEELHEKTIAIMEDLRPCRLWTILEWFPPFGIFVAVTTVTIRALKSSIRAREQRKEKTN
ncbi:CoaE-domain-containing protein [Metschnikowia bicuspidata var. bicuspidata NRRL YB-4993]|uniref:CoaE-domain-containing protein n=1 Tax=Metschnikowia bicuspidata var. bicuspidata NRRL YB-4993 TaxID=869754 RepID=A0A1A0H913_9ASCO|nr:CoaE-domain-containing protein [Metschnikowia bicuspidata var. bicuspidata NRRL YB-4993]OBA20614.1 CoaE-domain-containing protein [Metschnikowia bicuspidata var. bicuspidata NRRL YB-4993]